MKTPLTRIITMSLLFALLLGHCQSDGSKSCLEDGECKWGWFMGILGPTLFKDPCPPPVTMLSPGVQTLNTNGLSNSPYFIFPQVDGNFNWRITVTEKVSQNIFLTVNTCEDYVGFSGNPVVSQVELYDVPGDNYSLYKYYYFSFSGSTSDYEIQFEIPRHIYKSIFVFVLGFDFKRGLTDQ